jgi:hypothetical protein
MLGFDESATNGDACLESLAAELTSAVYPIALRHDSRESWAELELELWRVVMETVQKWELKCNETHDKPRVRHGSSGVRDTPGLFVRTRLQA